MLSASRSTVPELFLGPWHGNLQPPLACPQTLTANVKANLKVHGIDKHTGAQTPDLKSIPSHHQCINTNHGQSCNPR